MDLPALPFHLVIGIWSFLNKNTFENLLELYPVWLKWMEPRIYCFENASIDLQKDGDSVSVPDVFCPWIVPAIHQEAENWPAGNNIKSMEVLQHLDDTFILWRIPASVTQLFVRDPCVINIPFDALPAGLERLSVFGSVVWIGNGRFPDGLVSLKLFDLRVFHAAKFYLPPMPDTLRELQIFVEISLHLDYNTLPKGLEYFRVSAPCVGPLRVGVLPPRLKTLILRTQELDVLKQNVLPNNIEALHIDGPFSKPIDHDVFPNSIRVLEITQWFKTFDPSMMPSKLEELLIFSSDELEIKEGLLPTTLQFLIVREINQTLYKRAPLNCKQVIIPHDRHIERFSFFETIV